MRQQLHEIPEVRWEEESDLGNQAEVEYCPFLTPECGVTFAP